MNSRTIAKIGAAALVLASLALSSPAQAEQTRTLPSGETLYAIGGLNSAPDGQLASIDPATGAATLIGTGYAGPVRGYAYGAAYDPVAQVVYWVGVNSDDGDQLFSTDPATGEVTLIGAFVNSDSSGPARQSFYSLTLGEDGNVYALVSFENPDTLEDETKLVSVNTATGEFTAVGPLTIDGAVGNFDLYGAGLNPADGLVYAVDQDNGNRLYRLDFDSLALTEVAGAPTTFSNWYGLAFDSAGVAWSVGDDQVTSATVAGWDTPGDLQGSGGNIFPEGTTDYWYAGSVFVVYTPSPSEDNGAGSGSAGSGSESLASTGANAPGIAASIVALMTAGGVLFVLRKRAAG